MSARRRSGSRSAIHAAAVASLVHALRSNLEARGSSLVVERAEPALKRVVDVWGNSGPGLGLMRGVKAALDTWRVFAAGRFVGGV
jgi:hypothetical protein